MDSLLMAIIVVAIQNYDFGWNLLTFLKCHKSVINDMDGASYVSEIFTCNASDLGFNTKLELLINNYKKLFILK